MQSPIVTPIQICNKKFNTIPVTREISIDYSYHKRKPRMGDKVVYTSRNGSQSVGYFVGIKDKQETCIIYNADVISYKPFGDQVPHFSYMTEGHLRLINWTESGLPASVIDAFTIFLTELKGI